MRRLLALLVLLPLLRSQIDSARLQGTVVDPHSQPVVGALVLAERDGEVLARTYTDGSGLFRLTRLPRARLSVRVTTDAPDVGAAFVDLTGREHETTIVRTMPARDLTGTVHDDAGAMVANAWVTAVPIGAEEFGALAVSARSNAAGKFAFPHVAFGKIAVRAWAPGFGGFAGMVDGTANTSIACELVRDLPERRTFRLEEATEQQIGEARLETTALAGKARVLLPPAVARPEATGAGEWIVQGWPGADEMRAHVVLDGAFVEPVEHRIPEDAGDRTKTFYVVAGADSVVRGILRSDDGLRVGGRPLLASGPPNSKEAGSVTLGTTAEDGAFALLTPVPTNRPLYLRCPDRDVVVIAGPETPVQQPAFLWRSPAGLVIEHGADRMHDLRLASAATIRAHITDPRGDPYPGAKITVLTPRRERMQHLGRGRVRRIELGDAVVDGHADHEGTAALPGLDLRDGDKLVLQITGPRGCFEQRLDIGDERTIDLGELRCTPGATLKGLAEPGERIVVETYDGVERRDLVIADRDGRFTLLGLMAGPCDVRLLETVDSNDRGQQVHLTRGDVTEVTLR